MNAAKVLSMAKTTPHSLLLISVDIVGGESRSRSRWRPNPVAYGVSWSINADVRGVE